MITIIRSLFWTFILVQILLLIFGDKINRPCNAKCLNYTFVIKAIVVIAYLIYTSPPLAWFSDWFLRLFGGICLIGLMFLVWRTYLSKAIPLNKAYFLTDMAFKKDGNRYHVLGIIREGKYSFLTTLTLTEEQFMRFRAQGIFDEHSSQGIKVKIVSTSKAVDFIATLVT